MAKGKIYRELINTTRWRKLRASKLSAQPLCERCQEAGYVTAASEVHHRRPVEWVKGWQAQSQRMFDMTNLMSLCHQCHVEIHKELRSHNRLTIKEKQAERRAAAIKKLYGDEAPPGGVFSEGVPPVKPASPPHLCV